MLNYYEERGYFDQAKELKEKLKKAMAAKNQLEKIAALDFDKPKPELKKLADYYGINMNDPSIKTELFKMKDQNIMDIRN